LYWGEIYTLDAEKAERSDAGTYGKQGLYNFAHNATEDEAYEDREEHWTMAPEPYPPVFPSENVTVQGAGNIKKYQLTPRHQR
jgi:hypothetical protein